MNYNYNSDYGADQAVKPSWVEDLSTFYEGRIARQFVLHFNITDFVIDTNERQERRKGEYERMGEMVGLADGQQPLTMREYLHRLLFSDFACQAVYTYSLAGGLIADDRPPPSQLANYPLANSPLAQGIPRNSTALKLLHDASKTLQVNTHMRKQRGEPQEGQEVELPDDIAENFKLLGHLLRQPYYAPQSNPAQGQNRQETPVAVIIDYAEKLIPYQLGEGQGDREQLQALEVVQRWALDPLIRKTKNLVILLTTNLGLIPSAVYAEGSGCRAIRLPLPTSGEREAYIFFSMTRGRPRFVPIDKQFGSDPREQARRLARATQGMRLTDIDNMSRRVIVEYRKRKRQRPDQQDNGPLLLADDVQRVKAEVIDAQSAQLLEVVPPERGFGDIGGLEELKIYLKKRTILMSKGNRSPLVPSGLLLAGPPGTGKTIIAEALAKESGFNLVKMRNIQDKWVGSSERNLDMVLNLLKDLHPVVVFIDEIDQAMGRRDTGQSGDSGVGARMFARILEEMSNAENRGRILWVAATNRADIIDAALLRRFDRVVPLLTPDLHESCRIFATIITFIARQSGGILPITYGEDLKQSGKKDNLGRPDPTQDDLSKFKAVAEITTERGLTGAAIEIVVRRAIELAYEEKYEKNVDGLPDDAPAVIESKHLMQAVNDFKPNFSRDEYDFQSLLALRACNFHSVIPTLPETGVYQRIQDPNSRHIDPKQLEMEIQNLSQRISGSPTRG
ncbi:MAG TPA: ATP-binding protein [Ktedonobacteraceae bacterium]|nr:ATP-binding protein [Ktedonobacteraceae bacterium]